MLAPATIHLSISGVLNGQLFSAEGIVTKIDYTTGLKEGTVQFTAPTKGPSWDLGPGPLMTTRCFVGAKGPPGSPPIGPLDLLGPRFTSLRVTTEGPDRLSVAENAWIDDTNCLNCDLLAVLDLNRAPVTGVQELHETITVGNQGMLLAKGWYIFLTKGNGKIRADYTHVYKSAQPNPSLWSQCTGRQFQLDVTYPKWQPGPVAQFQSQSTIK